YDAECLYNSFQFAEAGKQYELVRDSTQDNRFLTDSAFATVLAWQKEVELEIRQQKIPDLKPLRSNQRPENETVKLIVMAESEKRLVAASDFYVGKIKRDDR